MRCSSCDAPAVVDQPYRGQHVCSRHFSASVEERVRAEFRRQLPRFSEGTIAVALSGGKDSAVALALARAQFQRRTTVRLLALSVDEGVSEYRPATLRAAVALTEKLAVEHRIVRAEEELGTTTDRAAAQLPGTIPCSFCGVWRRRLLNRAARDAGADALILGFNLDDLAQTVLMNLVRGDLDRLVRMAPHRIPQPGLVPRIAPLALVPEREVFLYARLHGLPFDHGECPHAGRAPATCSGRSSGSSKRPRPEPVNPSFVPTSSWSPAGWGTREREPPRAVGPVGNRPPGSSAARASTSRSFVAPRFRRGCCDRRAEPDRDGERPPRFRPNNVSSSSARASWGAGSPRNVRSRATR